MANYICWLLLSAMADTYQGYTNLEIVKDLRGDYGWE